MSPEQASAEALDGRSDLFSLAAVLYLLLTGRPAFEADSVPATLSRILFRDPTPASSLVPGLPPAIDRVLGRALAKKPSDRYPDAKSFAADLEAILAGREPEGVGSAPPASPGTQVARGPLPVAPVDPGRRRQRRAGPWRTSAPVRGPHLGRRELGCGVAALVLLAVVLTALGVRFPSIGGLGPSAPVEINFEHPLRSGVLKVFVDDALVLEEPLESWVKDDLVVMKVRKGRLTEDLLRSRRRPGAAPGGRRRGVPRLADDRSPVRGGGSTAARGAPRGSREEGPLRLDGRPQGVLKPHSLRGRSAGGPLTGLDEPPRPAYLLSTSIGEAWPPRSWTC